MDTPPPVSSLKKDASFTCFQQGIVLFLAGMMLDGGALFQVCFYAFAAFWGSVAIIFFRRKKSYTRSDLLFFRYGSIPLCIISFFLTRWIWHLKGHDQLW